MIEIEIAKYTMRCLVQQNRNLYREISKQEKLELHNGLLPTFSDLLENYLKKIGLECRARSSSGNGCNYSSSNNWPNEGYNYYLPLRPEMNNYLEDMCRIIEDQAERQNIKPDQVLENVLLPLKKADEIVGKFWREWFDDINTWKLSKEEREKSCMKMDEERKKAWYKTYQA